ncbi:N-acetylglucosamine-6-phosphate deacetylase [Marinobacterium nitratireducens]|uniref:N-acetylglucosamine-6-phosphate deacetylase n=1 Tax=Marinobacterium nitratireducens TaxID=518897 RepID=A0A917Z702_9GAMM|nr:N-acetylglucosamine-6-phosphate deacetylase [Marinobacterium nitratireducens]GGO76838.1 N-acetylglucosamine-6-phosphate deacetylase [Marinobacterium nitratireducens]
MMRYALTRGRVFDGERMLEDHAVLIDGGSIESLLPQQAVPAALPAYDLGGGLLVPGFIDTQVNGGAGVLFNDRPDVEGIAAIGRAHRRFGTTGFMPTLISDRRAVMERAIRAAREALESVPGALGIHLEGPYLNRARSGIHPEAVLREPESDALDLLTGLGRDGVTLVTLAPEVTPPGFIRRLHEAGVLVAAGHTAATFDEIGAALEEGLRGFTHLFNAMSPLTSRAPGAVGAALDDNDSWCGLIVDGHHVHPATLRVAIRAKAPGKMMMVTDAVQTVGARGHEFELLGQRIVREGGKVSSPEGVLAGSDLDMASAVRNSIELLGLPLEESLRMASRYPAEFLGLGTRLGRVRAGYDASLVLLDEGLNVRQTWIDGRPDPAMPFPISG